MIRDSWRIEPTIPTAGARGGRERSTERGDGEGGKKRREGAGASSEEERGDGTQVDGHEEVGREIINEKTR